MNNHDIVNEADLLNISFNASRSKDRFNQSESAIRLTSGYYKMAPRVYFNGNFTLMAWVKLNSIQFNSRLMDVGNGPESDNLLFGTSIYF